MAVKRGMFVAGQGGKRFHKYIVDFARTIHHRRGTIPRDVLLGLVLDYQGTHSRIHKCLYHSPPFLLHTSSLSSSSLQGLLACDMIETAKNIILNFMYMVEQHGFIPNGSRVRFTSVMS